MNIRQAIYDTMQLAHKSQISAYPIPDLSYDHLCEMYEKTDLESMSDTKLCRWLGWMQAAVVSWGVYTLDHMKEINKRNAG